MKRESTAFSLLQKIGQSFMLPIALLPIAGLLLGLGAAFSNPQMIASYHLEKVLGDGTFLNFVLLIMKQIGEIVFRNLPIIFAISVAMGLAKAEKHVAALSGAISFLIMHQTIFSLLQITGKFLPGAMKEGSIADVCGIKSLAMGVFGGIIVGLLVAFLHNRFYQAKLPNFLSFFGGVRFVPIISTLVCILLGVAMFFVWPPVQTAMSWLSTVILTKSGYFGTFLYGIIERALIPFGLHPVFYVPIWQTSLGGTALIDDKFITGAQNIFFAELSSPNIAHFSSSAARFMQGKFPFMMFGLPAAALAMYNTAKTNKKKIIAGLLFSAALTSFLTGITEPIEFTFLFVAPLLYAVHCIFAGLSFMILHMLNVAVGTTFSGGLIDLTLFGIFQGNTKTSWLWILPVGLAYAVIYYFLFRFFIKKFNLMTPGREADDIESKLYTKADYNAATDVNRPALIVEGLGGTQNIETIECCITRLRVKVKDSTKINKEVLKKSGALATIQKGAGVQVVYGPQASNIKSELENYISSLSGEKPIIFEGEESEAPEKEDDVSPMAPAVEKSENIDDINDSEATTEE